MKVKLPFEPSLPAQQAALSAMSDSEHIKKTLELNNSEKKVVKYSKGQIVAHSLFGKGKIIDLDGAGDEAKITVIFHGNVKKKLIAKYANLKIVYE